jgi:predicted TPR repeat methyltransferase
MAMNGMHSQDRGALRQLFDGAAPLYESAAAACRYKGMDWLQQQVAGRPVGVRRILDLGCATGAAGRILRSAFPDGSIVGVDLSPDMLRMAAQTEAYNGLCALDLDDLAGIFPRRTFDLAICLGVTEFLRDLRSFFLELSRILTPSGAIYATVQQYVPGHPEAPRMLVSGEVRHHAYTLEETVRLLNEASLDVESIEPTIGYVYRHTHDCPYVFVSARVR